MVNEIMILSDGTIENTVLFLNGVKQDVFEFSFRASIDDFQPELIIKPAICGEFIDLEKDLNNIKKVENAIATNNISSLIKNKNSKTLKEQIIDITKTYVLKNKLEEGCELIPNSGYYSIKGSINNYNWIIHNPTQSKPNRINYEIYVDNKSYGLGQTIIENGFFNI